MSVQLIVFPQNYNGYTLSSNISNNILVDAINFSTVNASDNTLISTLATQTIVQGAINYYNPIMSVNTWYRFYNDPGDPNNVSQAIISGSSMLVMGASSVIGFGHQENGIMQKLSGLVVGSVYAVKVFANLVYDEDSSVQHYSGTQLISNTLITESATPTTQTILFTAQSTEDTIVFLQRFNSGSKGGYIQIDQVTITGAVLTDEISDGQVICDLYEDENLPLTLSVDDFKNVAEKVQSYSKAFNLPATKRNNKIFDQMFEITRANDGYIFNPYKKTKCILKQDGFILFDGFLRMLDIGDKEGEISYNVNLYSEVVAFADVLQDRVIRDLDLNELAHLYNYDNIQLSQNNNTTVDYTNPATSVFRDNLTVKYPFVDWTHQYTVGTTGNPVLPNLQSTFRPFINIKYLIDKIFDATTFTYTSNFFDTNDFKSLYMDFNWGSEVNPNVAESSGRARYDSNSSPDIYIGTTYQNYLMYDQDIPLTAGYDDSTGIFTCPALQTGSTFNMNYRAWVIAQRTAEVDFRWVKNLGLASEAVFNSTFNNNAWSVIEVEGSAVAVVNYTLITGGSVVSVDIIDGGYYPSGAPTITFPSSFGNGATFIITMAGTAISSIAVDTPGGSYFPNDTLIFNGVDPQYQYAGFLSVAMEPGDTLQLQLKSNNANYIRQDNSPNQNSFNTSSYRSFIQATINIVGTTSEVLLQTLRGELGQWDFLKGLITMFNLVTLPDVENPTNIIIEPYPDIFINNANSVQLDWTDKIDISQIKLTPLTDLNRKTSFKFVEDDDDYPFNQYKNQVGGHLYGSYNEDAGNEFNILEGSIEIVAEPFAATVSKPLMSQFPQLIIPSIYSYNADDATTEGFENSPRILYNNGTQTLSTTTFEVPDQNNVTGNPTENKFLQFSHLTDIPGSFNSIDFQFGICQTIGFTNTTVNNLYNLYWSDYFDELYNPNTRTMSLKVNLHPGDIAGFKFNDTVYIKNRVFRVNKIDYKPNDLATVEFILIP